MVNSIPCYRGGFTRVPATEHPSTIIFVIDFLPIFIKFLQAVFFIY